MHKETEKAIKHLQDEGCHTYIDDRAAAAELRARVRTANHLRYIALILAEILEQMTP